MSQALRVGLHITPDDPYWVLVREAIYQRAEQCAIQLISIDIPDPRDLGDQAQVSWLEELLAQELDALIGKDLSLNLCVQIMDSGLPIIYATEVDLSHPLFVSPVTLYGAAQMIGRYLVERLSGQGSVLIVGGPEHPEDVGPEDNYKSRIDGIRDFFQKFPLIRQHYLPGPWFYDQAYVTLQGSMRQLAEPVDAIFGLSDSLALAGRDAGRLVGTVTGGTLIYNSYSEWLASPYSDPKTGKTCQQCHMPVSSVNWFVFAERGGLTRDYAVLHDHYMPGAADQKLLQNSVTMTSLAQRAGNQISLDISISNDKTGHDIPTDAPIRSMILVIEALDANGKPLTQLQGPVNPSYSGNYGGLPGKTFAKVLKDEWTGESPTAAYWRPVSTVADTRLPAFATDTSHYVFSAPAEEAVTIKVRLLFRRAFQQLAEQKGWDDPDILMEEATLVVAAP
jgi:DNA-binding LacI/PurR family transcriptional regulator